MLETHPFYNYKNLENNIKGGFVPKGTKVLIMGTFPPLEAYNNKEFYFYYSSERNQLWNRFDNIFKNDINYKILKKTKNKNITETPSDNKGRKERFVRKHSIGFMDFFSIIERMNYPSSKDKDIISRENVLDNGYLINTLSMENIQRICCVYSLAYLNLKKWIFEHKNFKVTVSHDDYTANKEKLIVQTNNSQFEIVLLFPATRSGNKGILKDLQYKRFLFEI